MEEPLPKFAEKVCRTHGRTGFVLEGRGYYRGRQCRMQRALDWRRRAKLRLIAEAGGCCQICHAEVEAGVATLPQARVIPTTQSRE